jgi:hypothetical protein
MKPIGKISAKLKIKENQIKNLEVILRSYKNTSPNNNDH